MKFRVSKEEFKAFVPKVIYDKWADFLTLEGEPENFGSQAPKNECCEKCWCPKEKCAYHEDHCDNSYCPCHKREEKACGHKGTHMDCYECHHPSKPKIERLGEYQFGVPAENVLHKEMPTLYAKINELIDRENDRA